ncbi:CXXC motif containing zinc binding protein [Phymastichus coffea]|uniref:CXXC motif containing zinc binding protein n=1 Tax=Phymastichus coffea TaxID=108790 RepID=UPI00273BB44E|nr:CXXC motif containing zinc binding protein [Phymastichus coffea]
MVKIALQLKANLENVESLTSSASPDFRWYMKFGCNNCGEVSSKWNYVSLSEETPAVRGSAVNHFVNKCKLCARENSLSIIPETIAGINADSCTEFKTVVVLDCRGLEPKEFSAREGWVIKAADNGQTFNDVDLSEGEWADYCDKTNQPVGVYEIQHNFLRVK